MLFNVDLGLGFAIDWYECQIKISSQEPVNVWSKEDLRDAANKDFGETEDKVHSGNHCFASDVFYVCVIVYNVYDISFISSYQVCVFSVSISEL